MGSPGLRDPAPPALRLVQQFLNTNDIEAARESFQSPEALREWLVEHELLDSGIHLDREDLAVAIELREALRALLCAHNGLPADTEAALEVINHRTRQSRLAPRLVETDQLALEPGAVGIAAALGRILALVYDAISAGTWPRMKACERDDCRWAFYDHSKNRSGRWCHSAICGNRERSRRAYRRRRAR